MLNAALMLFGIGLVLVAGPFFMIATAAWSGWRRLASSYPGRDRRGSSVRASPILMGMTNYRGGARLTPDDSYLHFSMSLLNRLGHPPFSIPWSDITVSRDEWPWFPFKGHPVIRLTIAQHQSLRLMIPLKAGQRILAGRMPVAAEGGAGGKTPRDGARERPGITPRRTA